MTDKGIRRGLAAAGLLAVGWLLAPAAGAAQAEPAQAGAADSAAAAQYKFNLAPAQSAPGAQAEVLLTPRETGGYSADLQASTLPDPASVKGGSSTYVVWLYDAASKNKRRVAELPVSAGAGSATFDILWPSFALVVTAEPAADPREWSGAAVLTGQPVVPANPGPDVVEAAADTAQAQAAAQPDTGAAAAMGAADAAGAAADTSVAAAAAAGAEVGVAAETGVSAEAGVAPEAGVSAEEAGVAAEAGVDTSVAAGAAAGVDPSAGVAAEATPGEGVTAESDSAAAVAAAEEAEEGNEKRKRKFKNDALDRMRAAAESEDEPAAEEAEEPEEETSSRDQLDAMAAAARGPEAAAKFDLTGTGAGARSKGRVEVGADGVARVTARDLPDPSELGGELNVFVLWAVDPASGSSRNLGVLQGSGDGAWSATVGDLQPGSALLVTAEPGPQSNARSGPAVLKGRWEN